MREAKGPWGPAATIAFTVLIAVAFLSVQTVLAIPYVVAKVALSRRPPDAEAAVRALQTDGLFFSLAETVGGCIAVCLTVLIAWLRRGPRILEYLALRPVALRTTLRWLLYTVLLCALLDGVASLAGFAETPDWMLAVYRTAGFLPLLFFSFLVVAPVLEELIFRGFLFEGIRRTWLGDVGTIVLASLAWASLHVQYAWFFVAEIFVLGLLLGAARVATRSLVPPILMHALFSAIATLQLVLESRS